MNKKRQINWSTWEVIALCVCVLLMSVILTQAYYTHKEKSIEEEWTEQWVCDEYNYNVGDKIIYEIYNELIVGEITKIEENRVYVSYREGSLAYDSLKCISYTWKKVKNK